MCRVSSGKRKSYLNDGHLGAAANYTRSAFELKLRMLCDELHIDVAFQINPKKYKLDALQGALNTWINKNAANYQGWETVLKTAIHFKGYGS